MTTNLHATSFEVYKYKFAKKILSKDPSYLMIYGGSSVTAGDDNQKNSSYPAIAGKRMKPVMDALGIELIVENIAQATNPCVPYGWIYEAMGHDNPDFVNWEQVTNMLRSPKPTYPHTPLSL